MVCTDDGGVKRVVVVVPRCDRVGETIKFERLSMRTRTPPRPFGAIVYIINERNFGSCLAYNIIIYKL